MKWCDNGGKSHSKEVKGYYLKDEETYLEIRHRIDMTNKGTFVIMEKSKFYQALFMAFLLGILIFAILLRALNT